MLGVGLKKNHDSLVALPKFVYRIADSDRIADKKIETNTNNCIMNRRGTLYNILAFGACLLKHEGQKRFTRFITSFAKTKNTEQINVNPKQSLLSRLMNISDLKGTNRKGYYDSPSNLSDLKGVSLKRNSGLLDIFINIRKGLLNVKAILGKNISTAKDSTRNIGYLTENVHKRNGGLLDSLLHILSNLSKLKEIGRKRNGSSLNSLNILSNLKKSVQKRNGGLLDAFINLLLTMSKLKEIGR